MDQVGFRAKLTARQQEIDSLVCVGLDPLVEKLPGHFRAEMEFAGISVASMVLEWMKVIVDATSPYASMYKPQLAHWEAIPGGIEALASLIGYIHEQHPGIVVFVDGKRGDIDRTQKQYGDAILGQLNADGMNYNGYMGKSTLKALVDERRPGRALVGLGRTSNPEAWEVQDMEAANGRPLWQHLLLMQLRWSESLGVDADAGIVMGAAHKDTNDETRIYHQHLVDARYLVSDKLWFLIPGIGTQGGFVEETVKAAFLGPGSIAINSSSGIIFASQGEDFAEAAAKKASELRDQIRAAGGSCKMAT